MHICNNLDISNIICCFLLFYFNKVSNIIMQKVSNFIYLYIHIIFLTSLCLIIGSYLRSKQHETAINFSI